MSVVIKVQHTRDPRSNGTTFQYLNCDGGHTSVHRELNTHMHTHTNTNTSKIGKS